MRKWETTKDTKGTKIWPGFADSGCGPLRRQQCRLFEDGLRRFLLLVRRVTVLAQDPFHEDTQLRADVLTDGSIDRHASFDGLDEFAGDDR